MSGGQLFVLDGLTVDALDSWGEVLQGAQSLGQVIRARRDARSDLDAELARNLAVRLASVARDCADASVQLAYLADRLAPRRG